MQNGRALLVPQDSQALRNNNFDAIRLAMALLVVWSHSFALWKGTENGEPISLLMAGTYNAGNLAVLAFFTISGFLITLSWDRSRSATSYLRRRIARIHPGYLVATTLCSLAVVPALSGQGLSGIGASEVGGMVSNLWLRNYILPGDTQGSVNGSLWSIPYEFWCYLGVMALGLAGLVRRRWCYAALAIGVIAVRAWLDMTGRQPAGGLLEPVIGFAYFWFNVAPPFLLGGAAYINRDRVPRSAFLLGGLLIATIAAAHLPLPDPMRTVLTRILFPAALSYTILYCAFSPSVRAPKAARFGDFSYGAYLYAFPIQRLLEHFSRGHISFPVYILLSLILSLLAGVASWHLIEKWFLPKIRRGRDHRKDARPLMEEAVIVAP